MDTQTLPRNRHAGNPKLNEAVLDVLRRAGGRALTLDSVSAVLTLEREIRTSSALASSILDGEIVAKVRGGFPEDGTPCGDDFEFQATGALDVPDEAA